MLTTTNRHPRQPGYCDTYKKIHITIMMSYREEVDFANIEVPSLETKLATFCGMLIKIMIISNPLF